MGADSRSMPFFSIAEAAFGILLLCAGRILTPWAFMCVAGAGHGASAIHSAVSPGHISAGVVLGLLVLLALVPVAGLLTGFGGARCVQYATGGRFSAPAGLRWVALAVVIAWALIVTLSLAGVISVDVVVFDLALGLPTGIPWAFLVAGFCGGIADPRKR